MRWVHEKAVAFAKTGNKWFELELECSVKTRTVELRASHTSAFATQTLGLRQ